MHSRLALALCALSVGATAEYVVALKDVVTPTANLHVIGDEVTFSGPRCSDIATCDRSPENMTLFPVNFTVCTGGVYDIMMWGRAGGPAGATVAPSDFEGGWGATDSNWLCKADPRSVCLGAQKCDETCARYSYAYKPPDHGISQWGWARLGVGASGIRWRTTLQSGKNTLWIVEREEYCLVQTLNVTLQSADPTDTWTPPPTPPPRPPWFKWTRAARLSSARMASSPSKRVTWRSATSEK